MTEILVLIRIFPEYLLPSHALFFLFPPCSALVSSKSSPIKELITASDMFLCQCLTDRMLILVLRFYNAKLVPSPVVLGLFGLLRYKVFPPASGILKSCFAT